MADKPHSSAPKKPTPILELDTAKLRPPEIHGYANRYMITDFGDYLELGFFQQRGTGRLAPVFRAIVSIDDAVLQLWGTSRKFAAALRTTFAGDNVSEFRVDSSLPFDDSVPAYAANITPIAKAGLDAQVDFYYLTPRSVHLAKTRSDVGDKGMYVVPIATVTCSTRLVLALLNDVEALVEPLSARFDRFPEFKRILAKLRTTDGE